MEVVINGVRYAPVADDAAAKALETDTIAVNIVKASEEHQYVLGLAYPSLKPDVSRAADGHVDAIRPQNLEVAAWTWMEKHRDVGLHHADGTVGHAKVVESYVYRGPDWDVQSPVDGETYVIKAGDWLCGAIFDDTAWAMVKSGHLNGWSPQGGARRQTATTEFLAQLRG